MKDLCPGVIKLHNPWGAIWVTAHKTPALRQEFALHRDCHPLLSFGEPHYLLCDELCVFVLRMRMRMRGRRWWRGGGVKSGFDPQLKGLFVLQLTNPEFNLVLSCLLNLSPPSSPRVLPSLPASLFPLHLSLSHSLNRIILSQQVDNPPPRHHLSVILLSPSSIPCHLLIFPLSHICGARSGYDLHLTGSIRLCVKRKN